MDLNRAESPDASLYQGTRHTEDYGSLRVCRTPDCAIDFTSSRVCRRCSNPTDNDAYHVTED